MEPEEVAHGVPFKRFRGCLGACRALFVQQKLVWHLTTTVWSGGGVSYPREECGFRLALGRLFHKCFPQRAGEMQFPQGAPSQ